MIDKTLLITGSTFVGFLLTYFLINYLVNLYRKKMAIAARLSDVSPISVQTKDKARLFHKKRVGIIEKKLNSYLTRFKSENWFQLQLYRSGLSFTLIQGVTFLTILVVLVAYIESLLTNWSLAYSFMTAFFGVVGVVWFTLRILMSRRQKLIVKHLPAAVDMLLRSLKSGYSIEKTFVLVANEMHPSIAGEFQQIVQQLNIGVSYEDALRAASERVHVNDFYFLVNALIIQRETGGSLSETLENILFLLHRRNEIRLKTHTLSAESKTTGLILGIIPVAIWGVVMFFSPTYMDFFLYDPSGEFLLRLVIGLLLLEAMIIKWLVNIKVD